MIRKTPTCMRFTCTKWYGYHIDFVTFNLSRTIWKTPNKRMSIMRCGQAIGMIRPGTSLNRYVTCTLRYNTEYFAFFYVKLVHKSCLSIIISELRLCFRLLSSSIGDIPLFGNFWSKFTQAGSVKGIRRRSESRTGWFFF